MQIDENLRFFLENDFPSGREQGFEGVKAGIVKFLLRKYGLLLPFCNFFGKIFFKGLEFRVAFMYNILRIIKEVEII